MNLYKSITQSGKRTVLSSEFRVLSSEFKVDSITTLRILMNLNELSGIQVDDFDSRLTTINSPLYEVLVKTNNLMLKCLRNRLRTTVNMQFIVDIM